MLYIKTKSFETPDTTEKSLKIKEWMDANHVLKEDIINVSGHWGGRYVLIAYWTDKP